MCGEIAGRQPVGLVFAERAALTSPKVYSVCR